MLEQPVSSEEFDRSAPRQPQEIHVRSGEANPFPGLRSFTIEESHLFFGREEQVDDILIKLSKNRFLAVMGHSGSGKSSLMFCGLIPVLYGGFVTNTSPNWHIITSRPGSSPIKNLARAIVEYLVERNTIAREEREVHERIVASILKSSQQGLVEVSKYIRKKSSDNIFYLIDQFEEVFRMRENDEATANDLDEAQHFVNLLLTAIGSQEVSIFGAITMRSDFIGKCSVFPKLTNLINESNYLVPQLTRDQKRKVIEGPIAVAGGRITARLVKKLLTDVGNDQDQLPLLQHALMRTWDYWIENREPGEFIDLRHYNSIGKISQALSLHANEAYDELPQREKEIAEILFKNVTEKNQENKGMRRACRLDLVTELSQSNESEVVKVINHFRQPGRSFLMPPSNVSLSGDSLIELSHESLMRIWNRLDGWVEEEFESAQMYKRLSEAAAMYQIGKTGLWRPPDLQLALNWQKKQKPTRAWGQRYDEAFERAVVFLDTSRITYEAELKNQEMMQKRVLRRTRATAIILGAAAVIAILFMVFAYIQRIEANKQTEVAMVNFEEAEKQKNFAITERNVADSLKTQAVNQRQLLEENNRELERLLQKVTEANQRTLEALKHAEEQERIALNAKNEESLAKLEATHNYERAQENYRMANKLFMLTKAQALAAKSRQENDDDDLAGLLAMQGYHFHRRYEGKPYDPYVYSGLYYALTKLNHKGYNAIKVSGPSRNRINSIVETKGNTFYAAGADGRIIKGDYLGLTSQPTSFANPFPNRVIALSKDGAYLINGSDSSFVQIVDPNNGYTTRRIKGFNGPTNDIEMIPGKKEALVASGNPAGAPYLVTKISLESGELTTIASLPEEIKRISLSPDGKHFVGASWSGRLYKIETSSGRHEVLVQESQCRILSTAYSPDGKQVAYGIDDLSNKRGMVKIVELATGKVRTFSGHTAGVFDVEFSPDGALLASAGADRKLQLWVLENPEDLPIEMDNNNGFIFDIMFTRNSDYLLATTSESEIRVWPTDMSLLARKICPELGRNLTLDEWKKYVGDNIKFENTCLRLLINEN